MRFLSDGDHEGNDVVAREVQDFAHGLVVEAVHRAGVVAEFSRRKHERLAGHATGTHGFITLNLWFAGVILRNGGNEKVLNGFGALRQYWAGFCSHAERFAQRTTRSEASVTWA